MHRYRRTSAALALLASTACSGHGLGRHPVAHRATTATSTPSEKPEVQQPPTAAPTTTTTEATATRVATTTAPATTAVPVTAPPTTRPRATTTAPSHEPAGEWAIPTYIVMCESGGDWMAHNPSGASGPYQLMPGHFGGALAMHQSREAQHAKADELWAGGRGRHHWRACL